MEEINIKLTGMNQDVTPSLAQTSSSFDNLNIRFTGTDEGKDSLCITNEKGTSLFSVSKRKAVLPQRKRGIKTRAYDNYHIEGSVIGYAIVLDYLVVFSTYQEDMTIPEDSAKDHITIFSKEDATLNIVLEGHAYGDFDFSVDYPIETLVDIERADILKVYWVDGNSPLRMIIVNEFLLGGGSIESSGAFFDSIKGITTPNIEIEKLDSGGTFAPGVIQYAFTYYSNFKGESNICYLSPLFYLSYDKGVNPESICNCSFNIKFFSVDLSYDFIRIYSIERNSIDGTPVTKLVDNLATKDIVELMTASITYSNNREDITLDKYYETNTLYDAAIIIEVVDASGNQSYRDEFKVSEFRGTASNARHFNRSFYDTDLKEGETIKIIERHYYDWSRDTYTSYSSSKSDKNRLISIWGDVDTDSNSMHYKVIEYWTEIVTTPSEYDYLDNGEHGEATTSSALYYVGGEKFIPKCLARKDDTLFLGNYTVIRLDTPAVTLDKTSFEYVYRTNTIATCDIGLQYYSYVGQLQQSNAKITTFKAGETYRFGILFQDKYGRWSSPMYINDFRNTLYPKVALVGSSTTKDLVSLAIGKYTLSTDIVNSIIEQGFIKARPVVVFPEEGEQEVLFLGVANPTLAYGTGTYTRVATSVEGQERQPCTKVTSFSLTKNVASWFFRPKVKDDAWYWYGETSGEGEYGDLFKINGSGVPLNYNNGYAVPTYITVPTSTTETYIGELNNVKAEFLHEIDHIYKIDWNIITIDSPELLFNELLATKDLSTAKIRIIGYADPAASCSSYLLLVDGSFEYPESFTAHFGDDTEDKPFGNNYKVSTGYISCSYELNPGVLKYGATLINYPLWVDAFSDYGPAGHDDKFANWYVFPWNRVGALNNCASDTLGNLQKLPETLNKKYLASLKYTRNTNYIAPIDIYSNSTIGNQNFKVFLQTSAGQTFRFADLVVYENELNLVETGSGITPYCQYGTITQNEYTTTLRGTYYLYNFTAGGSTTAKSLNTANVTECFFNDPTFKYADPVYDKLSTTDTDKMIAYNNCSNGIPVLYKTGSNCVVHLPATVNLLDYFTNYYGYPIIEVYKEKADNKFGGTSETALEKNNWLQAGEDVDLVADLDNIIYYNEGDTYYQRYDCLKTYPYGDTAVNNIIEILSFMCETRINIDGRYDINRGLTDNTNVTIANFNLLNPVYNQKNNYFTYNLTAATEAVNNTYPNLIVWTLSKKQGDEIDVWLNNTLTNYINLDGDKGSINAIKLFKDNLVVFLNSGISLLKYNLNIMINAENSAPIEIANSGKVTGYQYLETSSGCTNKWAIAETPTSLAYVDSYNKALKLINPGEPLATVSDTGGMRSWFHKNVFSEESWTPLFLNDTYSLLYSKRNNELLLTSLEWCLAYNFYTNSFTSFYSYENTPWLVDMKGLEFFLKDAVVNSTVTTTNEGVETTTTVVNNISQPWLINEGEYDSFFGSTLPYHINMIVNNPNKFNDMKIFDTLEIRDNLYLERDANNNILKKPFDYITTTNSYQSSDPEKLESVFKHRSLNLKAKFRVWRINIPREGRARMRDHYLLIWLESLGHNYKTLIEAMRVLYT